MEQNKITRPLEVIETEINFYKQQTATGIIEIGKRLIEAKSQVEHGLWGKWLEEKVDFSVPTATRFMKVANEFSNVSTLKDLSQSKVFALLSIPQEDRDSFLSTPHSTPSGEEKNIEEMTTREVEKAVKEWKLKVNEKDNLLNQKEQEYIKQKQELEKQLQQERNKEPETIDNTDYITINKLNEELENLKKYKEYYEKKSNNLKEQLDLYKKDSKEYENLKTQINNLTQQKDDISRQIVSATSLSSYVIEIENFIKNNLAPIKYSRAILEMRDNQTVINNISEIVECVELWCAEIRRYLPKDNNYIIIESEDISNE